MQDFNALYLGAKVMSPILVSQLKKNFSFSCIKNDLSSFSFLFSFHEASQPPTTIPPPTTELIETTTSVKKVVNYLPPVGQTTVITVLMIDKGEERLFAGCESLNFN